MGVPTAFTPTFGGDGTGSQNFSDDDLRDNDVFFPQLQGIPVAYSFTVYNRWVERILPRKALQTRRLCMARRCSISRWHFRRTGR